MPRIRTLKPEFWADEKLGPMDPITRLVFLGLISMADDAGRLVDSVRQIDALLFPYTEDSARESLATLARSGRIVRGATASGQQIIQVANWRHQKVDHPNLKAALPPIAEALTPPPAPIREDDASGSRELRDSTSDQRPSTSDPRPPISDRDNARERFVGEREEERQQAKDDIFDALLKTLPPEAMRILDTFYEPALTAAARDRWRKVAWQLINALDPKHRGPMIRGGAHVKARNAEHMNDACRSVLNSPPRDRDAAIVFVLKKLLDPPKGPSETELASKADKKRKQLEDAYAAEAKRAGVKWARDNPKPYAIVVAEVDRGYEGIEGDIAKMSRDFELARKCAEQAGFPNYDTWLEQRGAA